MKELLFLAHRIPYPPNKGDKIRSYNLLKHLTRDYRVHLGAFVDDPADWRHAGELRRLCAEVHLVSLRPRLARLKSLSGLLRGEALTLPYYRDVSMAAWVDRMLRQRGLERVLVFSAAMAQYVRDPAHHHLNRVIDFVDVDSDKWRQYGSAQRGPMGWVYRREGDALLQFERDVAGEFSASVFVSAEEADLFRRLAPESGPRLTHVSNGVDLGYFSPREDYPDPYPADTAVLCFTGAMDYRANADAVDWFAREVFPAVHQALPGARFYVVGARPTRSVRQLATLPGVEVTGAVRDIRPYLAHARAAVAPLRIARGVQNKVLEAMAMGRPVLATRAAMDGIVQVPGLESLVADEPDELAARAIAVLLEGDTGGWGALGRACVEKHYDWAGNLARIEGLLEHSPERVHA